MAFSRVRIAWTRTMATSAGEQGHVLPRAALLDPFGGLLHAGGLALQTAQEVQLRAAYPGGPYDIHLGDRRRMQREDALHSLPKRYLAHRERRTRPAAVNADDHALEDLYALLVTFADLHVHPDGISGFHVRSSRQLRFLDQFNRAHCSLSCSLRISSSIRRSSSSRAAVFNSSGRRFSVRRRAVSLRHRRTSSWCPESSTSGTLCPANSDGRV